MNALSNLSLNPGTPLWEEAIPLIHKWSTESRAMLPLNAHLIVDHQFRTVALHDGRVVGYAAITFVHDDYLELGGLVVDPAYRRNGTAVFLTLSVLTQVRQAIWKGELPPETKVMALANSDSGRLFQKLGAEPVVDTSQLPGSIWEMCGECPNLPSPRLPGHCCDVAMDFDESIGIGLVL